MPQDDFDTFVNERFGKGKSTAPKVSAPSPQASTTDDADFDTFVNQRFGGGQAAKPTKPAKPVEPDGPPITPEDLKPPATSKPRPQGPIRQPSRLDTFGQPQAAQRIVQEAQQPVDPESRKRVRIEQLINRTTGETTIGEDVRNRIVGTFAKGIAAVPEMVAGAADLIGSSGAAGTGPGAAPPSVREMQNLERAGASPRQASRIVQERQGAQMQRERAAPTSRIAREKFTQPAEQAISNVLPTDPGVDVATGARGFFQRDLSEGIGSLASFAAVGALGRAAQAPRATTALFGALQNAQQAVRDYDASGKNDVGRRQLTYAVAGLIGSLEAFGLGKTIEKFGGNSKLRERIFEAGEEGLQEYVSQVLNDVNAGYIGGYDPSRAQGAKILYSPEALKSAAIGTVLGVGGQLASAGAASRAESNAIPFTGPAGNPEFPKQTQITPKSELEQTGRRLAREDYEANRPKPQPKAPPVQPQPAAPTGGPATAQQNAQFAAEFNRLRVPGGKARERAGAIEKLASTDEFQQFARDLQALPPEQQAPILKGMAEDFKKAVLAPAAPLGPPAPNKAQTRQTEQAENLQSAVELATEAAQRAANLQQSGDFQGAINELTRQQQALREQISNITERGKEGQRRRADLSAEIENITYQKGEIRRQDKEAQRAQKQQVRAAQLPLTEKGQVAESEQVAAPSPTTEPGAVEQAKVPRNQGRTVTVGGESITLTPEQEERWKAEIDPYKGQKLSRNRSEEISKLKREIVGQMTGLEIAEANRKAGAFSSGSEALLPDGTRATVYGTAYGKIRIQMPDGSLQNFDKADLRKPPAKAGADVRVFPASESPEYDPTTQKLVTFRGRDRGDYIAVVPKSMRTRDAETFGRAKTPEAAAPPAKPGRKQTPSLLDTVVNPEGGIPKAAEMPVDFKPAPTEAPEELPTLTKFVKEQGGIKTSVANKGELRQVGVKEAGGRQIGLLNKKGVEADVMRQMAIEAGYGDERTMQTEAQFLQKLQDDAAGRRVTSNQQEYDYEDEYKKALSPNERAEVEAFDKFLDDPEGARAYDRVTGGDTSSEALRDLESTLDRYGFGYDTVELFANEGRRAANDRADRSNQEGTSATAVQTPAAAPAETGAKRTTELAPEPSNAQPISQKRVENEEPPIGREETTRPEVEGDTESLLARDLRQVPDYLLDNYIDELKQARTDVGGEAVERRLKDAMAERRERLKAGRVQTRQEVEIGRDQPLKTASERMAALTKNPEMFALLNKAGRGDQDAAQRFIEGAPSIGIDTETAKEMVARKQGTLKDLRERRGAVEQPRNKADYVVDASKIPVKTSSEGYDIFGRRVSDEQFKAKAAEMAAEANKRFDEEDAADENSRAFKKWFRGSKIVDENGKPIAVFHGTTSDFESFDLQAPKKNPHRTSVLGIWFTKSPVLAETFARIKSSESGGQLPPDPDQWFAPGANVRAAYLSMKNPEVITAREWMQYGLRWDDATLQNYKQMIQANGKDGILVKGDKSAGHPEFAEDSYVVFDPQQIKSAYSNRAAEADTLTHPDPELDGKPIIAKLDDGRVVVPNPDNKDGVSRVLPDRGKPEETGPMVGPNTPESFEGGGFKIDDRVLIKEGRTRMKGVVQGVLRDGRIQVRDELGDVRPVKPEQLERPGEAPARALSPEETAVEKLRSMRGQPQAEAPRVVESDTRPTADLNLENAPQAVKDAVARLKEVSTGKRAGSGGQALADQAIVTGYKLYRAGMKFAEWSKAVTRELGAKVRPYLKAAWDTLQKAGFSVGPLESDKTSKGQILSANPIFNPDAYKQIGADIKEFMQSRLRRGQTAKDLLPLVTPNAKGNSAAMQAGVRKESLEWLDLPTFLEANPNATRAEIEQYINENEPKISVKSMKSASQELGATTVLKTDTLRMDGPSTNYREVVMIWDNPPAGTKFTKEEHYGDTANVLFDARLEDRQTADGKNASFFLEGQSDWSQATNSPPTPFKSSWQNKIAEYVIGDAVKRGMDGILLPRTAQQVAEIQRWGRVEERDGRWFNRDGYDVTPIVKRYLKEWPKLIEKIGGAKLETKTVDVGHGQTEDLLYLPLQKAETSSAPQMRRSEIEPGANYWETKPLPMGPDGKPQQLTPAQTEEQISLSRAEFREHKTRARLYANDQGTITYAAVMKAAKPGSIADTSVDGIAIPISTAGDMLLYLKGMGRSHPNPQRRNVYNSLMGPLQQAINYALDNGKPAIVLANTDAGIPDMKTRQFRPSLRAVREVVSHEETHIFQFEQTANRRGQGLGLFDDATITSDPDYQQHRNALLNRKYSEEYLDPQGVNSEAMAFVVSGQWKDVGYTNEADAVKYLERTFGRIYDQYGPEALNSLRVRTQAARGAKENVRVARDRSRGLVTDSAGIAGRASQGQSGNVAAARRPPPATDASIRGGSQEESGGGVASARPDLSQNPPQGQSVNPYLAQLQQETAPKKAGLLEKLSTFRKAGFLGGVPTHLRNIVANLGEQVMREGSAGPAALLDALISTANKRRTVAGPNPLAMARAGREGAIKGYKKAKRALLEGQTADEIANSQRVEVKYKNRILQGYTQAIFRSLGAEDAMFSSYALQRSLESRAKAQAISEAKQKQITRDQIGQRTRELVENPPAEMALGAEEDSLVAVFQNENWLSNAIQSGKRELPPFAKFGVEMFMPYDKTPTNIIFRLFDYSPAGLAKAGIKGAAAIGRAVGEGWAQRKAGAPTREAVKAAVDKALTPDEQKDLVEVFGHGALGSGLLYLGYQLAAAGMMTGFYDEEDKSQEARNRAAGKQPMALNLGGRSWNIGGLGPVGMLLATGATLQREVNRPLKDESRRSDRIARGAVNAVSEIPFLQGAKEFGELLRGPGSIGQRAGRMAAGAIPTVGGIGKLTDPYEREAGTFVSEIVKEIPGARRMLPVKRDPTGQEMRPGYGGRLVGAVDPFNSKPLKSTPLLDQMERLGMGFGKPKPDDGEPENLFKARVARSDKWYQDFGGQLVQHPEFGGLKPAQQRAALNRLRSAINRESKLKEPNSDKFDPETIIQSVKSAEERKEVNRERKRETQIYAP